MSGRSWRTALTLLLATALAGAGCGGATPSSPPPPASPPATLPAVATSAPTPTRAPTAAPTATPAATPSLAPTATPLPTPSPSPAAVVRTVEDYVWAFEKRALTLKGSAGTSRWTRVLFAARTVDLRWKATPATSAGCTFRYQVESTALAKPLKVTAKLKGSKAGSGSRAMTIKYGNGVVTVTTDCLSWSLKVVSTGHPGITLKQSSDAYRAKGTTAAELNDALFDADLDWSWRYLYKYTTGGTVRLTSITITARMTYEMPTWTPPEGTDPLLVEKWKAALVGLRKHLDGEAALGIQYIGRFLAAAQKKSSFSSLSALEKYLERVNDRSFDAADERYDDYNKYTDYGWKQGAYLP